MDKLITTRNLTLVNFSIVAYFLLIWLINLYEINFVLIGVLRELLTIPFLIAQIVFLIVGVKYLLNKQRNLWTVISIFLLAISAIITIGSFF